MQYLQGKSENLTQSDLFVGPPLNKNYSDEGSRNFIRVPLTLGDPSQTKPYSAPTQSSEASSKNHLDQVYILLAHHPYSHADSEVSLQSS